MKIFACWGLAALLGVAGLGWNGNFDGGPCAQGSATDCAVDCEDGSCTVKVTCDDGRECIVTLERRGDQCIVKSCEPVRGDGGGDCNPNCSPAACEK
jgi:hypothetical protein